MYRIRVQNDRMTNIQKFQYLRGLLSEESASIIKHIPISKNNILKHRQNYCQAMTEKRMFHLIFNSWTNLLLLMLTYVIYAPLRTLLTK